MIRPLLVLMMLSLPAGLRAEPMQDFLNLIHDDTRGRIVWQQLMGQSFATRLHSMPTPLTLDELSQFGASYDPRSDTPYTAGMFYYHMAQPISLLREIGGGGEEVLARIAEARIRWLAGDTAGARFQLEDLVVQFAAIGAFDEQMVSILADLAVLAYRDGDAGAAQGFLDRARSCAEANCPLDYVFDWMAGNRGSRKFDSYDADQMRERALADAAMLLPRDETVLADIRQEHRFMTGAWGNDLSQALAGQGDASAMADRAQAVQSMAAYLIWNGSVAHEVADVTRSDGSLSPSALVAGKVNYSPVAPWASLIEANWPILIRLYEQSDHLGDQLVARSLRARLLMMSGEYDAALTRLRSITSDGKATGFSNRQLFSILMDLRAAMVLARQTDGIEELRRATVYCQENGCDEDLVKRLSQRHQMLPRAVTPKSYHSLARAEAEASLRDLFPGDLLKLADFYEVGVVAGQSRPMDAARSDLIAFELAEQHPDIAMSDLAERAARVMDTLVYAGQYRQAAEIGDRVAARVLREGSQADFSLEFHDRRARASFRLDDPRAKGFYDLAVDVLLSQDESFARVHRVEALALDLLDTGYDDTLLHLIAGKPALGDIRARVLFRQKDYAAALAEYRAFRRFRSLANTTAITTLDEVLVRREAQHQLVPNLDALTAARQLRRQLFSGKVAIEDHPIILNADPILRLFAVQHAYYLDRTGQSARAAALQRLAAWSETDWPDLDKPASAVSTARFAKATSGFADSMDLIRDAMRLRDSGNYQAAALWMRDFAWVAQNAEINGTYLDAQTLWQMAFTFARVGDSDIAFDLMDRAARIAANLSFEGASEGTLQLLERDRWRYLLFVDIAWTALSGQAPDDMLVVSRY